MKRLLAVALTIFVAAAARGATITVTSASDATANDGLCTLREALVAANNNVAGFNCPARSRSLP